MADVAIIMTCPHDLTGSDPDTATYCPEAVQTVVVTAQTPAGSRLAFVASVPPTAEDVRRLADLGAMPGVRDAEWSAAPGTSSR